MYELYLNLIRKFPPEFSHLLTLKLLKYAFQPKLYEDSPILHQHIFGLDFINPIGIAAGFDKNAEVVSQLLKLGLGFVEAGVTGLLGLELSFEIAVAIVLVDRTISFLSTIVFGGLIFFIRQINSLRYAIQEKS